jgi:hypothetical protein
VFTDSDDASDEYSDGNSECEAKTWRCCLCSPAGMAMLHCSQVCSV